MTLEETADRLRLELSFALDADVRCDERNALLFGRVTFKFTPECWMDLDAATLQRYRERVAKRLEAVRLELPADPRLAVLLFDQCQADYERRRAEAISEVLKPHAERYAADCRRHLTSRPAARERS